MPKGIEMKKCHDHNAQFVVVNESFGHDDLWIYFEYDHYTCDLGITVMYVIKDSSNKTI